MTPWLLPENRAALEAVLPHAGWSHPDEPGRPRMKMIPPDGNGWGWSIFVHSDIKYACSAKLNVPDDEAECRLNMAALAYIEADTPIDSVVLRIDSGKTVTEQIIQQVKDWLPNEGEETGGATC